MIVIIVALSYVPGVADHETAFAATQPSSGRTSDAKGDIVLLTTELGRDDNAVQDQVVKLDAETSSVTRLLDFGSRSPITRRPPRMRARTIRMNCR